MPHLRGQEDCERFLTDLRAGRTGWPAELERAHLWYEPHLDRIHEDCVTRHADLIQVEQIARGYPSRERLLTELTLDPFDAMSDQAGVPLLTRLHQLRGLGDAKLLKSLGCSFKGRHYRG